MKSSPGHPGLLFILKGGIVIIDLIIFTAVAVIVSYAMSGSAATRWQGNRKKIFLASGFLLCACVAGIWFLGAGKIRLIQMTILASIFSYISYGDIKTHEADDYLHIMVLICAMISLPEDQLLPRACGAFVLGFLMLLTTVIVPGTGIGGADIKFTAACAFLIPVDYLLLAFCLGLFLALIFNAPIFKKKGAAKGFPMLPYLSVGFMLVYLLV